MNKKKQFEKVCRELSIDPATIPMIMDVKDALKLLKSKEKIPKFLDVEKSERPYHLADWSIIRIVRAMNLQPDGKIWRPDYHTKPLEEKWEPWYFEIKADAKNPSGSGFANYGDVGWLTASSCGSRFAFQKRDRMRFVLKQFEGLFEKKILLNKK